MKYNQKKLSKLINALRLLEKNQAQNRVAVREALKNKDVSAIKRLSKAIRDNRRKPNGLRDLNNAVRKFYNQ